MLDLSSYTFLQELTVAAKYNGVPLGSGLVLLKSQEGGREDRDRLRIGLADHAIAYVRKCEKAIADSPPKTRDVVSVIEGRDEIDYLVLSVIEDRGGAVKLMVERSGSRRIGTRD